MFPEAYLKWCDRMGVARPTHLPHGMTDTFENPLKAQLPQLKCTNWRLSGRELTCDTDMGPMTQTLDSTNYICHGTDENGLPILTKIQPKG